MMKRRLGIVIVVLCFALSGCGIAKKMEKADEALSNKEYEEAIEIYKEILEKDEDNVEAYKGILKAYIAIGEFDKADKYYEIASDTLFKDDLNGIERIMSKKRIELSKRSVTIEKGEEVVIKIDNYEDDLMGIYLNYRSEDSDIAMISEEYDDAFVIQGKGKGKTTISVKGNDCYDAMVEVEVQ